MCENGSVNSPFRFGEFDTFEVQPCDAPENLMSEVVLADGMASARAELNWMEIAGAEQYRVFYRQLGSTTWQNLTSTETSTVIEGLVLNVTYQWGVRTDCGDNNLSTITFSEFETPDNSLCASVTDLTSEVKFSDSDSPGVKLSWTGVSNAVLYRLLYRLESSSNWVNAQTASTSFKIEGLLPNESYIWGVRSVCEGSQAPFVFDAFSTEPHVDDCLECMECDDDDDDNDDDENKNSGKIKICHRTGNGETISICVSKNALEAHLDHGDRVGSCDDKDDDDEESKSGRKSKLTSRIFPNPFNHSTRIEFASSKSTVARVTLYSAQGMPIAEIFSGNIDAGRTYSVEFDAYDLQKGMYFLRIKTANGYFKTNRLIYK